MTPLEWALVPLVVAVCCFQALYLVHSLRVRVGGPAPPPGAPAEPVSVLVPLFDSASTIGRCLEGVLSNDLRHVAAVVVVADRCTDGSDDVARSFAPRFEAAATPFEVVSLPAGRSGKVAAVLHGGELVRSDAVLLLDADVVLAPTAVAELAAFHGERGPFCTCLLFPHQAPGDRTTLTSHVICNNRLYRQSVLQAVKSRFGVANFPGGVQLVHWGRYRALLRDGFLEDLTATYQVLAAGGEIAVLPRVLAHELERETIKGLFLQRVRWTIGALQHVPTQLRTARARRSVHEKILVNSYHVMWELQHYAVVVGLVALPFAGAAWPVLGLPAALYTLQIARSAWLTRRHYDNSVAGVALHCVVFPWVITAALVGSVALLARKRAAYFDTTSLFRRDGDRRKHARAAVAAEDAGPAAG